MKLKIFLILLVVFGFIYWRGTKALITQKGWECSWRSIYAICSDNKKILNAASPSFMDVIKAGTNFKK